LGPFRQIFAFGFFKVLPDSGFHLDTPAPLTQNIAFMWKSNTEVANLYKHIEEVARKRGSYDEIPCNLEMQVCMMHGTVPGALVAPTLFNVTDEERRCEEAVLRKAYKKNEFLENGDDVCFIYYFWSCVFMLTL
jgi:hypothetical protein